MGLKELKNRVYNAWFRFDKAKDSLPDETEFLPQAGYYTGSAERYYRDACEHYDALMDCLKQAEKELETRIKEEENNE